MTRPNRNPLTPACLAANGTEGAGADTQASACTAEHSPLPATALTLALWSIDAARARLDRYALGTDTPAWAAVDAADLLDAAHAALASAVTP